MDKAYKKHGLSLHKIELRKGEAHFSKNIETRNCYLVKLDDRGNDINEWRLNSL
jgi:hypothetical protein